MSLTFAMKTLFINKPACLQRMIPSTAKTRTFLLSSNLQTGAFLPLPFVLLFWISDECLIADSNNTVISRALCNITDDS